MSKQLFLFIYMLLIIYGSLYPCSGWFQPELVKWQEFLIWNSSRSDIILNFLVYIPFGLLFIRALIVRIQRVSLILLVTAASFVLSLSMESLQLFLPYRISSLIDLLMNILGACVGALLGYFAFSHASISSFLLRLRRRWFHKGMLNNYGLLAVSLWVLSQLAPLVPSPAWSNIKHGLKPVWHTLQDFSLFNPIHALVYALNLLGLGVIVILMGRSISRALFLFGLLIVAVLMFKVPVVGRQLSLEAVSGCLLAFLGAFCIKSSNHRFLILTGALSITTGVLIQQFAPVTGTHGLFPFNWMPFEGHLSSLMGLAGIVESIWPFMALGFLGLYFGLRNFQMALAGLTIVVFVFLTEWIQQYIPGRYPDITAVVLAMFGWGSTMLNPIAGYTWESS